MGDREITYTVDRQGKPAMLSVKESLAQQVLNGLFMIPGNIPNIPIGVNIEKYLYTSGPDSDNISDELEKACGSNFMSSNIGNIECGVVNYEGNPLFFVNAGIRVNDEEKDSLGLVVTKVNNSVRFNHKFASDSINKAYGT